MMRLSLPSRERLKRLEGFRANAYIPVPGDRVTIGYGFTDGVRPGDKMTRAEADARLIEELRPYEMAVWQGCTREPNQNEFDAMVLLCFNIGPAGFRRSTVLRAHNLLNKLHALLGHKPLVLFYPGHYSGQSLALFNKIPSNNYYRAFKLVP